MQTEVSGISSASSGPQPSATSLIKGAVPDEIARELKNWDQMARWLRITFVFLGCVGTVSGLLATSSSGDPKLTPWTKLFTISAAASIGLLTAFDIGGKANAVRRAWRILNVAVLQYKEDPEFSVRDLIGELRRGEDIIGDVNYIPQKIEPRGRPNRNPNGPKTKNANTNGASNQGGHQPTSPVLPANPVGRADS